MRHFAQIVIGAGAIGTAAAYRLAAASGDGSRILVLERFELAHPWGSSEDHSRIIRHSYHSPIYTKLTPAAYRAWAEIEAKTGLALVHRIGGLDLAGTGTPGATELDLNRAAMAAADIPYEDLDAADIRRRWPQWHINDDVAGIYQADGGILDIRHANAAHVALARDLGVQFSPRTPVREISATSERVTVVTDGETFTADAVALCVGSWLSELLPGLGVSLPITLSQEQVSYFATSQLRAFARDRFPIWVFHDDSIWYGFPVYGEPAVKVARDMASRFITQETRSYEPDPTETAVLREFLRRYVPAADGPERLSKTCVYDMPPDRDFIIDTLPGQPRVSVCVGSGHAGKFAALIGSILADLAIHGGTDHPIEPFRADRESIVNPDLTSTFRVSGALGNH